MVNSCECCCSVDGSVERRYYRVITEFLPSFTLSSVRCVFDGAHSVLSLVFLWPVLFRVPDVILVFFLRRFCFFFCAFRRRQRTTPRIGTRRAIGSEKKIRFISGSHFLCFFWLPVPLKSVSFFLVAKRSSFSALLLFIFFCRSPRLLLAPPRRFRCYFETFDFQLVRLG